MASAQNSDRDEVSLNEFLEELAVKERWWQPNPQLSYKDYYMESRGETCVAVRRAYVNRCKTENEQATKEGLEKDLRKFHNRYLLMDNEENVQKAVYLFLKETFGQLLTDESNMKTQAKKVADILLRQHAVGKVAVYSADTETREKMRKESPGVCASGFGIFKDETPKFITNSHAVLNKKEARWMKIQTSQPNVIWRGEKPVGWSMPTYGPVNELQYEVTLVDLTEESISKEQAKELFFSPDEYSNTQDSLIEETARSISASLQHESSVQGALSWSTAILCFAYSTGNEKIVEMVKQCQNQLAAVTNLSHKNSLHKFFPRSVDMSRWSLIWKNQLFHIYWLLFWLSTVTFEQCSQNKNCAFHQLKTPFKEFAVIVDGAISARTKKLLYHDDEILSVLMMVALDKIQIYQITEFTCCENSRQMFSTIDVKYFALINDINRYTVVFVIDNAVDHESRFYNLDAKAELLCMLQIVEKLTFCWKQCIKENTNALAKAGAKKLQQLQKEALFVIGYSHAKKRRLSMGLLKHDELGDSLDLEYDVVSTCPASSGSAVIGVKLSAQQNFYVYLRAVHYKEGRALSAQQVWRLMDFTKGKLQQAFRNYPIPPKECVEHYKKIVTIFPLLDSSDQAQFLHLLLSEVEVSIKNRIAFCAADGLQILIDALSENTAQTSERKEFNKQKQKFLTAMRILSFIVFEYKSSVLEKYVETLLDVITKHMNFDLEPLPYSFVAAGTLAMLLDKGELCFGWSQKGHLKDYYTKQVITFLDNWPKDAQIKCGSLISIKPLIDGVDDRASKLTRYLCLVEVAGLVAGESTEGPAYWVEELKRMHFTTELKDLLKEVKSGKRDYLEGEIKCLETIVSCL